MCYVPGSSFPLEGRGIGKGEEEGGRGIGG